MEFSHSAGTVNSLSDYISLRWKQIFETFALLSLGLVVINFYIYFGPKISTFRGADPNKPMDSEFIFFIHILYFLISCFGLYYRIIKNYFIERNYSYAFQDNTFVVKSKGALIYTYSSESVFGFKTQNSGSNRNIIYIYVKSNWSSSKILFNLGFFDDKSFQEIDGFLLTKFAKYKISDYGFKNKIN